MGTTAAEAAEDLAFVLKLIHGLSPGEVVPAECGRPQAKRFLFEVKGRTPRARHSPLSRRGSAIFFGSKRTFLDGHEKLLDP
jgi:hypothetical protein